MSSSEMIWQNKMIQEILRMQREMGCPPCSEKSLRVYYSHDEVAAIYDRTREQHRAWLARQAAR